jgi:hypothetical protein
MLDAVGKSMQRQRMAAHMALTPLCENLLAVCGPDYCWFSADQSLSNTTTCASPFALVSLELAA